MKTVHITYFVHGTTTDNEKDLATGWSPGKLSESGIRQAKELGALVSDKEFDVVFCSDLKRAVDSAEFGFGGKYRIMQDERLRECDYGDFTGKPAREFKDNMADYVGTPFPHGESYERVEKRVSDFLDMLKREYCGKRIAIVAHQTPPVGFGCPG